MKILFTGDVCPGGVLAYQDRYISEELLEYMKSFDLRVGTLESAIGDTFSFDERKMEDNKAIVYSRDIDFQKIIEMGFDVVTLANNHSTDLGTDGLQHTIDMLNQANIKYCGAGKNIQEARKPTIVNKNGCSIAFIGCLFKDQRPKIFWPATETTPGVYQTTIDDIVYDIKEAKKENDIVVVLPHWAQEHVYLPRTYCVDYAKVMIQAGADAIIGSHPHIINPNVTIKGKPVFYSLGNFLFADKCLEVPRPMTYSFSQEMRCNSPREWNYPKSICFPTISVWRGHNRVGMAVTVSIQDKRIVKANYKLVALSPYNVLSFHKGLNMYVKRFRMWLFGLCAKSFFYNRIHKVYINDQLKLRRFIHAISRKLNIYYDVKVTLEKKYNYENND